jgi:hypothetical protein
MAATGPCLWRDALRSWAAMQPTRCNPQFLRPPALSLDCLCLGSSSPMPGGPASGPEALLVHGR